MKRPWSAQDAQRFRDGDRLRASSVPGRRDPGPSADEWNWEDDPDEDPEESSIRG